MSGKSVDLLYVPSFKIEPIYFLFSLIEPTNAPNSLAMLTLSS